MIGNCIFPFCNWITELVHPLSATMRLRKHTNQLINANCQWPPKDGAHAHFHVNEIGNPGYYRPRT